MDFIVRRLRLSEGPVLRELRLAALAEAPWAFASTYAAEAAYEAEYWEALAERRAAGQGEATFVAEAAGRPIGIVSCYLAAEGPCVRLVSIWTAPEARRNGVATALIGAVTAWARERGAEEVKIWVTCANGPATALYRSLAFTPTGEYQPLPSDPTKTEQRMRLALDWDHPNQ